MINEKYNFTCAQDWAEHFEKLFNTLKINSILEFGLGIGTQFLCDNANLVTSVELSVGEYNKIWTEKTKETLKAYNNWELNYIEVPEEIRQSNQQAIEKKYPLEEDSYLFVLKRIVEPFIDKCNYDIIFVDPGIHNRGDIVNMCFNKSKILAAHDTSRSGNVIENIYGYNIVKCPSNYQEVHIQLGLGTTFWINKDKVDCELLTKKLLT